VTDQPDTEGPSTGPSSTSSLDGLDDRLRALADELNHALIEELADRGELTTPAWRAAFEAMPRHLFAPRFTLPQNLGGNTHDITGASTAEVAVVREEWLRAVYRNEALLTEFDETGVATTSCSAPSVVATMLEASQTSDGNTVLEIGTGTGWTAALLTHRLGAEAVTSVDIDPRCVTSARDRLDRLGLNPALAVADGYLGYPARAPYDRIIATAALRKIPPAWLTQTRAGGTILTDLRGNFAGNLALLTVDTHRTGHIAHGRFLPATARFMPLRSTAQPFDQLAELSARAVNEPGDHRTTTLDPATLRDRDRAFAFLAQLALPGVDAGHVIHKGPDGRTMYFCLTDPHTYAWARVSTDGIVTQGGERRLWDELETARTLWHQLGQPRPENFTITIADDGQQTIRLADTDLPGADLSGAGRSWTLPL
jgi:protein-L-isoaspartate(D-aspartate) O-methyltransferase